MGDKAGNIHTAVRMIGDHESCEVTASSSLYLTKPVGVEDQPNFLNAVIEVRTTLAPRELLDLCGQVEKKIGRERTIRWGPRVIDIDILLYEGIELDEPGLTIPHPRMMERAFVLVPLAEIAPDILLECGITAREAAERMSELSNFLTF